MLRPLLTRLSAVLPIALALLIAAGGAAPAGPDKAEGRATPPQATPGQPAAADSPAEPAAQATQQAAMSPDEVATLERIERYLNGITTIEARFIQTSSDGTLAEGSLKVKRPGRVRFEYDDIPIILVSNGRTLLYFDRELDQTTYLPLWETPLWFLVKEKIEIDESDFEVVAIDAEAGLLRVTLNAPDNPEYGTVTLDFVSEPLQLKRWRVVDAQGVTTQVSLLDPRFGVAIDSDAFEYGELDLPEPAQNRRSN